MTKWVLFQKWKGGYSGGGKSNITHQNNRGKKKKNHMIISVVVQKKEFDKIQHPLMTDSQKNRNRGNILGLTKGIH